MVAAVLGIAVALIAFGGMRLRALDVEHRRDKEFDADAIAPYAFGSVLIGAGAALAYLAWSMMR